MGKRKTNLTIEQVLGLLEREFAAVTNLRSLKEGLRSQVFSFKVKGKGFVIRFCKEVEGFQKDDFANRNFTSTLLPIPEILKIGQVEEGFYAISEKVSGQIVGPLNSNSSEKLLGNVFRAMNAVHNTPIPNADFGRWDKNGNAKFDTFADFAFQRELPFIDPAGGFYSLDDVYNLHFVDGLLLDNLEDRAKDLLKYIPDQKWLVHGDFGFDNLMVDGSKVTGVLDWSESRYGDFLEDLAHLDFWAEGFKTSEVFRKYYQDLGIEIPDFDERLLFHKLILSRESLAIHALEGDLKDYFGIQK